MEHVFAVVKRLGLHQVRYRGLAKNATHFVRDRWAWLTSPGARYCMDKCVHSAPAAGQCPVARPEMPHAASQFASKCRGNRQIPS